MERKYKGTICQEKIYEKGWNEKFKEENKTKRRRKITGEKISMKRRKEKIKEKNRKC